RVVQHPVQLVDGVRAERVANLRTVEGDPDHRQVAHLATGPVHTPVVGQVREVEPGHLAPPARVEQLGHLGRKIVAHPPYSRLADRAPAGWPRPARFPAAGARTSHRLSTAALPHGASPLRTGCAPPEPAGAAAGCPAD